MIRDRSAWERWESQYQAREAPGFEKNLAWMEALYAHARALGAFPPALPMEGLETKIRMARILNVSTIARKHRAGLDARGLPYMVIEGHLSFHRGIRINVERVSEWTVPSHTKSRFPEIRGGILLCDRSSRDGSFVSLPREAFISAKNR